MSTVATAERADCLIWSGEYEAYWASGRAGYRESARYAGRYTRAEAKSILEGCGPSKRLAILPAPEYEDKWEALAESLSKHFAQRASEYLIQERALVDILRALRVDSQEMKDAIRRLEAPR